MALRGNWRNYVAAASLVAVLGILGTSPILGADENAVEYRLTSWKMKEFSDNAKAKTYLDTLKSLGCEVTQEAHGNHVHVRYRCMKWQQFVAKGHEAAHQWEKWLRSAGFETKHSH